MSERPSGVIGTAEGNDELCAVGILTRFSSAFFFLLLLNCLWNCCCEIHSGFLRCRFTVSDARLI